MTSPLIRSVLKTMAVADIDPTEFHWFDISAIARPDQNSIEQSWLQDYRPPFEKCMVCWQGTSESHALYDAFFMVHGSDPEQGILITLYKGPHGQMPRSIPTVVYLVADGQVRYGPVNDEDSVEESEASLALGLVGAWYRGLSGGTNAYQPAISTSFTNKRKVAQGKTPSYDWKTVVIEAVKPKAPSLGGTHSSPRQHDRRGHLRRLSTGKNVWVKPCKVGSADLGAIFHDYELAKTKQNLQPTEENP